MARVIKLTWQDGQSKRPGRWRKVYRGVAYVFPGGRGKSDVAAYDAAVAAYEAKKREIDLAEDRVHEPAYENCLDEWQAVMAWSLQHGEEYWARRAEDKVAELRQRLGETKLKPVMAEDWISHDARLRPFGLTEAAIWEDRLKRSKTAPKGESVADYVKLFLAEKSAQESAGQLSTARRYALGLQLEYFQNWIGADTNIKEIDGLKLTKFHAHLLEKLQAGTWKAKTASHYLAGLKMWMQWLYDSEAIEAIPRGLQRLVIRKPLPTIKTFAIGEVKTLLAKASPRTRLYCLLALNCGMYQIDVADLRRDEVDLEQGTITRKRSKTRHHPNPPRVTYRLWSETLELVKQEMAQDGELALLGATGKPLMTQEITSEGKFKKTDCVKNGFFRLLKKTKLTGSFKLLRKTSASMLKDSDYNDVYDLFLGLAAGKISDKHYAKAAQGRLTMALAWLAGQYGIS
jgi:integrase